MSKRTVELCPSGHFDSDGTLFTVVRMVNTVEFSIGETLSTPEVKEMIRRPGFTVIVKERKGG